ncbi:unnamed protein product [Effrenium voratum]|uniref:Uncharacterized protein n=1 Tax=Effrenium voratum TaxID=2562239 RepID=A0AA36ITR2_9DINO|nr:unnamed protein product [Effrenium voratum]CAJ1440793.1 unnamed protein product [Effrenium voratum]
MKIARPSRAVVAQPAVMAPRKVPGPKYRKFWDGARPQVWLVEAADVQKKAASGGHVRASSTFQETEPSESSCIEVGSKLWSRSTPFSQESYRPVFTPSRPSTISRVAGSDVVKTAKYQVLPPWGPERANKDHPPWEAQQQKQLEYRQILDQQTATAADLERQRKLEVAELEPRRKWGEERRSIPSLATKTHEWEQHFEGNRKALMEEQLAAAASRQRKEMRRRKEEEENSRAWLAQAAADRAQRYFSRRQQRKEELSELSSEWAKEVEEKRRLVVQQRDKELLEQRQALQHLTEGMVPSRRLRKPATPLYDANPS